MTDTKSFSPEELRKLLRERFGLQDFQGPQLEAIQAVMAGRDVLLTLPTGGGKSLVYQLPALALDGMVLVVSPLIALMKDQVDALRAKGIAAQYVNSSLDGPERKKRLQQAARGELDLLYVTPERFRSPLFQELEASMPIVRVAIDEAHCISEWGHDFRPDYWRLGSVRRRLGGPPVVAVTATATPAVAEDICSSLAMQDPLVIRLGIERENLFLGVTEVDLAEEKVTILAERIAAMDGPGIVYSTLIRDLEALHSELRRRGIHSLVYHGKLSSVERRRMQERFMKSEREVVLATNAFGMGVDKSDIRFVLHAQVPRTIEAWTQEVGRAGRDGKPSWCELLYFKEDLAVQQNFINWSNPTREYLFSVYETLRGWGERLQIKDVDDLRDELLIKNRADNRVHLCLKWLEVLGVTEGSFETNNLELVRELEPGELPDFVGSEGKMRADLEALLGVAQFAGGKGGCRRVALADHFHLPPPDGPCGTCDLCTDAMAWRTERMIPRPLASEAATANESAAPILEAASSKPSFGAGVQESESDPHTKPKSKAGHSVSGTFASQQAKQSARRDSSSDAPADTRTRWERGDWVRIDGRHMGQIIRVEGEGRATRLIVESASDLRLRKVDPRRKRVERL